MTSLEPRTSGEALGSALAIAMALFVFAAQTFRRVRSGSSRATECLQQNSLQSTQAWGHAMAEKAAMQRPRSGHAGGQPAIALPATFGRPNAASISRRTFTARSFSS